MNKKLLSLLFSLITCFFLINFLKHSELLIQSFYQSISLWFYNLLPNIFIFFTITDILNNYHFPYYVNNIFGKFIKKIYHIPKESSYILFMSMLSGFPGNSKLIRQGLDNNQINSYEATKILTMNHFSNPIFIIYVIGINYFKSFKIGIIILISHFITNFIIGFLFRNIYKYEAKKKEIKLQKPDEFINVLKNSFINTTNILINVFGIVIFFFFFLSILNKYLELKTFSNVIFNGLIEITNGINLLSLLNISKIKAATLATFFISFGGFSIHMQVMSILNKYSINYYIYFIARILHGTLSAIITFLLLAYS